MSNMMGRMLFAGIAMGSGVFLSACSSESSTQSSIYDRQEQALKRPFDYKPGVTTPDDMDRGGVGGWDSQGMKRDVDHVLNP